MRFLSVSPVFICLPSSGEHWETDKRFYPRKEYWDCVAGLTGAQTVHFKDVEGMKDFGVISPGPNAGLGLDKLMRW